MASINKGTEVTGFGKCLRRLARISAWLLLLCVVILILSGWGTTHTEIIYKATFGLIDRRLANSIHRATNIPIVVFFLSHVLINIRLNLSQKTSRTFWLTNSILILVGLVVLALVLYVEYLA
jgi:hypothetical protein